MKNPISYLLIVLMSFALITNSSSKEMNRLEAIKDAPVIDGKIDAAYSSGVRFASFVQQAPNMLAEPSVKTEIYFLYDKENVYVTGKLFQPKKSITSSNGRKDASVILDGDAVGIIIDPLNNGNSAYFFTVNPSNAIGDGTLDASGNWDFSWDGIFFTSTSIEEDYWSFEFRLPLSSIGFQEKEEQDWGIMFRRDYAMNKEVILNQIVDKNEPFRISDFYKLRGLTGLHKENKFFFIPYSFYSYKNNVQAQNQESKAKIGGEIKYHPISTMSVLATFNPDFAQIETDRLIINVDDVPTSYPEKRPFFTESSDLYQGLAVNTRNIEDIDAGIKLRDVQDNLKYDITGIVDRKKNKWYLGNVRWSDNKRYYIDFISGMKNNEKKTDYNVTVNLKTWALEKRFIAYTWFGTINRPNAKNEFESVNSVRWVTRELTIATWNHVKTTLYNPNITGHNTLSNELLFHSWAYYSAFNETGIFRVLTPKIKYEFTSLYTDPDKSYHSITVGLASTLHLGTTIGNWNYEISYAPKMNRKFRYRNTSNIVENNIFEDAFSKFMLVDYSDDAVSTSLGSDNSKAMSFNLSYNNRQVRKSKTDNFISDLNLKMAPASLFGYSIEYIKLRGSEYQHKLEQFIHRLKAEYNITDKINARGIIQLNTVEMASLNDYESTNPILNLTLSWQYRSGSFIYFVWNKQKMIWNDNATAAVTKKNDQSIAMKINAVL